MKRDCETSGNGSRPEGRYANYFKVGHNAFEFVFDFGQLYSENGMEQFHTRVITGPVYAKTLLDTLRKSVEQYEKAFGVIPPDEGGNGPAA
jgi:hypothetical protein